MNSKIENTSGQGSGSVVPDEIRGWNWGAFLLNWIWGLGNSTFIALLMFVPLVNIFMVFILGFKGNEWAWRNQKWKSIEAFKKEQRTWTLVASLLYIGGIGVIVAFIFFLALIMKSSDAFQLSLEQVKANPEVISAYGEPLKEGFFVQGGVSVVNDTGNADIEYSIEGSKDKGMVYVVAFKEEGRWQFIQVLVISDTSQKAIIISQQ